MCDFNEINTNQTRQEELHENLNIHEEEHQEIQQEDNLLINTNQNLLQNGTVLPQNAPIGFNLAANQISAQERAQIKVRLKETVPEEIKQMDLAALTKYAHESVLINSGSPGFLAIDNELTQIASLKAELAKKNAENQPVAPTIEEILNHLSVLTTEAKNYVSTHSKLKFKGWSNKGKCRVALAKKLMNENELIRQLEFVYDSRFIAPSVSLDTFKVQKIVFKGNKDFLNKAIETKNSEDAEKVRLYKALNDDIGGDFNRGQYLEIANCKIDKNGFTLTEEEEAKTLHALDQYYNKHNNKEVFALMDARAKEIMDFKISKTVFTKKYMLQHPEEILRIHQILGAGAANLFEENNKLPKEYFAHLGKKQADKLRRKCSAISILAVYLDQAIIINFGTTGTKMSNAAIRFDNILDCDYQTNSGLDYSSIEFIYDDEISYEKDGKLMFKSTKSVYDRALADAKERHCSEFFS